MPAPRRIEEMNRTPWDGRKENKVPTTEAGKGARKCHERRRKESETLPNDTRKQEKNRKEEIL